MSAVAFDRGDVVTLEQQPTTPGNIRLITGNGLEVMRFEPNGDIFVSGRLAENDREVVDTFRKFIAGCRVSP